MASVFASLGLAPAGDNGTFFQQFAFTAGVSLGPTNQLTLHTDEPTPSHAYVNEQDWRPLVFAKIGTFAPVEIVFAGYGIVVPAADGHGEYDSYAHLDVTDKWVLVFRYLPEQIGPELRQHLNRYARNEPMNQSFRCARCFRLDTALLRQYDRKKIKEKNHGSDHH